jgi:hypothetical protein
VPAADGRPAADVVPGADHRATDEPRADHRATVTGPDAPAYRVSVVGGGVPAAGGGRRGSRSARYRLVGPISAVI